MFLKSLLPEGLSKLHLWTEQIFSGTWIDKQFKSVDLYSVLELVKNTKKPYSN